MEVEWKNPNLQEWKFKYIYVHQFVLPIAAEESFYFLALEFTIRSELRSLLLLLVLLLGFCFSTLNVSNSDSTVSTNVEFLEHLLSVIIDIHSTN